MEEFMREIFRGLPEEYGLLRELQPEQFVELMRRLMSLRFRMKRIPRRIVIMTNSTRKVVGSRTIRMANDLLTRILERIRIHGRRPRIILRYLCR